MWLILDNPWVCLIFMITMYTMKVIILIFTYMEYLISTNSKFNALRDGDAGNSNIMTFILYKTFIQVSKTQIISYFFTFWVYASKGTGTDWADLVFFMKSRPGMTRKWCQTAWHNFFVIQIGLTNCASCLNFRESPRNPNASLGCMKCQWEPLVTMPKFRNRYCTL